MLLDGRNRSESAVAIGATRAWMRKELIPELPFARPRRPLSDARQSTIECRVGSEVVAGLRQLADEASLDLRHIVTAAFQLLIGRFCAQDAFCMGFIGDDAPERTAIPLVCKLTSQRTLIDLAADVAAHLRLPSALAARTSEVSDYDAEALAIFEQLVHRVLIEFAAADELQSNCTRAATERAPWDLRLNVRAATDMLGLTWTYCSSLERECAQHLAEGFLCILDHAVHASPADVASCRIAAAPQSISDARLSSAQRAIWLHLQAQPAKAQYYNISTYVEIRGPISAASFEQALRETVARTAALRLQFRRQGRQLVQSVATSMRCDLELVSFSDSSDPPAAAHRWLKRAQSRPFAFDGSPLFRFALLQLGPEHYYWFSHYHHLVMDGVGLLLVNSRVAQICSALTAANPVAEQDDSPSLLSYLHADAEYRCSLQRAEDRAFWKSADAAGSPGTLSVNPGRRAADDIPHESEICRLNDELVGALRRRATELGLTLPVLLIAAVVAYLGRITAEANVTVGIPWHGRHYGALKRLIAVCANLLPLQCPVTGSASFAGFAVQVQQQLRSILRHARYRNEDIRRDLDRRPGDPLFNVIVNALPFPETFCFGQASGISRALTPAYVDDLAIWLFTGHRGERVSIKLDGNPARYEQWELDVHLRALEQLLSAVARDARTCLAALPLVAEPDACRLRALACGPREDRPNVALDTLLGQSLSKSPDALAILCGPTQLTYGELEVRARGLGHRLRKLGAGPDQLIAVFMERSPDLLVTIIGVLLSGAAYLPLDVDYPAARLRFVIDDAQPLLVLTQRHLAAHVALQGRRVVCVEEETTEQCQELDHAWPRARGENVAYCMYTSGSTGVPAGVAVTHASVVNHALSIAQQTALTASDRVLQFSSISFDASVEEIVPSLISGATLVLQPQRLLPTHKFLDLLRDGSVTIVNLPVAYWDKLVADLLLAGERLPESVRLVIVGGEKVNAESFRRWRQLDPHARVDWLNTYGPTEATISCIAFRAPADFSGADVPIGRPLPNVRAHVLDAGLQPLPAGVPGELCLAGSCLARGYLNRPELQNARFVDDRGHAGERLYRTGDIVRYLPDGNLQFLGRRDSQVKVNGYRIELAEVEGLLLSYPSVRQAVAVLDETAGYKRLAAYIVLAEGAHDLQVHEMRAFLRERAPDYMVPALFICIPTLPLTASGKLNRRALPAFDAAVAMRARFEPPCTETERVLAGIWQTVLNVDQVGVHDNFFELGGSSLLAVEVLLTAEQELGLTFAPGSLENRTLREVAAQLSIVAQALSEEQQMQILACEADPS